MTIRECISESYFTGEESIEDALREVDVERRPKTLAAAIQEDRTIFAQEPESLARQKYYKVTVTIEECPNVEPV